MSVPREFVVRTCEESNMDLWFKGLRSLQTPETISLDECMVFYIGDPTTTTTKGVQRCLRDGANSNRKFQYLWSNGKFVDMVPSIYSVICRNNTALRALIETKNLDLTTRILGYPILHWTTALGNLQMVQTILSQGVMVNGLADNGETPLLSTLLHISSESLINKGHWEDQATQNFLKNWLYHSKGKLKAPENLVLKVRWDGNTDIAQLLIELGAGTLWQCQQGEKRFSAYSFIESPKSFTQFITDDRGNRKIKFLGASGTELSFEVTLVNITGAEFTAKVIYDVALLQKLISEQTAKSKLESSTPLEIRTLQYKMSQVETKVDHEKEAAQKQALELQIKAEEAQRSADEARRKAEASEASIIAAEQQMKEMQAKQKEDLHSVSRTLQDQLHEKTKLESKINREFVTIAFETLLPKHLLSSASQLQDQFHELSKTRFDKILDPLSKHLAATLNGYKLLSTGMFVRNKNTKKDACVGVLEFIADACPKPFDIPFKVFSSIGGAMVEKEEAKRFKNIAHLLPNMVMEDYTKQISVQLLHILKSHASARGVDLLKMKDLDLEAFAKRLLVEVMHVSYNIDSLRINPALSSTERADQFNKIVLEKVQSSTTLAEFIEARMKAYSPPSSPEKPVAPLRFSTGAMLTEIMGVGLGAGAGASSSPHLAVFRNIS